VTNMDTFPQGATAGGFRAAAGAWGVRYASATDPAKASSAALILPVSLLRELDDGYLMASTALRRGGPASRRLICGLGRRRHNDRCMMHRSLFCPVPGRPLA